MGWVAVLEGDNVLATGAWARERLLVVPRMVQACKIRLGLEARPASCRGHRLKGFGGRMML